MIIEGREGEDRRVKAKEGNGREVEGWEGKGREEKRREGREEIIRLQFSLKHGLRLLLG